MLLALIALSLASCATSPPKAPPATQFTLNASPKLNPNVEGRPSPVIVRIYQLAARDDFDRAGFFDLYDHDKDVLGGSALARTDIAIRPGEQLHFSHQLDPKTRNVAVMAAYRDIEAAHWRAVADISAPGTHALSVALGASSVAISDDYKGPQADWGALKKLVMPVWQALGGASGVPSTVAMPEMPKVEMPKVEMPKVEMPEVEMPKVEMPEVEMPKVELPKVELPKVELPKVELPKVDAQ
ncbi:type VI secretion system lipoprotein TssJ [Trinickia fusca]|uniref:type VI secretion system lipoprotein TssJ n=1 Tax=Trinickia fusca TaxID=2419777 RepID=UPI001FEB9A21|nr:type VI secretion system lipoprotein TssJ [Trinickia fusca]